MLYVIDITTIESDEPYYVIQHSDKTPPVENLSDPAPTMCETHVEYIEGKVFVNNRGERVDLGLSKKAADTIGFSLGSSAQLIELHEEQVHLNALLIAKNVELFDRLEAVITAGYWTIFKWLFTGVQVHGTENK